MKFTCSRQDLSRAIGAVIKATYGKFQKSILECIHISAGDLLMVDAFDTVTAIRTQFYGDVEEIGEAAIPARVLQEVVSKFPEEQITLESRDNGSLLINGSRVMLQGMDAAQFPAFPAPEGKPFTMKQADLKRLIDKTAFSAYQEEDKLIFTGILMESEEDGLSAVAIDGVRLAKTSVRMENAPAGVHAIVPAKALKEVARLMTDDEAEVSVSFGQSTCFIDMGSTAVYTRLLDGDFMNYRSIIPASCKTRVRVERDMLVRRLEMVAVLAREDNSNLVRLNIGQNVIALESTSEYGAANEEVPVLVEGEVLRIAFNARYLLDVFRVIEDDAVFMEFNDSLKPCIIRPVEGDGYLYVVVPMKVGD